MRSLISAVAGLALLAGVAPHRAAADVQTPQPQRTITVTAGQGGSMTIVLPPETGEATYSGPGQAVAVTAGQAGTIHIVVPGPSVEVFAAAKAQTKGGARMTMLPNN